MAKQGQGGGNQRGVSSGGNQGGGPDGKRAGKQGAQRSDQGAVQGNPPGGAEVRGKERYQPGHRNRVSDQGGNRGSNTPGQSRGGGAAGS